MWSNTPTGIKGAVAVDPKDITPADKVRMYPNEPISVSNKKLFCMACREELAMKKSVINLHVKSVKYVQGKKRLLSKKKHDEDNFEFHPGGKCCLLLCVSLGGRWAPKSCVSTANAYFKSKFEKDLKPAVLAFDIFSHLRCMKLSLQLQLLFG